MPPAVSAAVVGICVPIALVIYLFVGEWAIRRARTRLTTALRVALWLSPAAVLITAMLLYPLVQTIILSFRDKRGEGFVGIANYVDVFTRSETLIALRNNLIWLVFFTALVTGLGLIVAALSDKVSYEKLVRTIVILPTAISFVGAGVIWGFVYSYAPPGLDQTGTLNALLTTLIPTADPIPWLSDERTVNAALIFIAIWMSVGLATIILSAAIKGVPAEMIEAARLDGASEMRVFFSVLLPQIATTVVVVITLMSINALKVFDIIYVLTNGNYGSQVLATSMYSEMFSANNLGSASAIAVVLLLACIPIILVNLRYFSRDSR